MCVWINNSFATTYFVSNSGNDGNNGTSTSTPFLTFAHTLVVAVAGDVISLNGGNTFPAMTVNKSGTSGNPITINSYGSGQAIITGFSNITSWTNISGSIWESNAAVSTFPTVNIVVINGVNTGMGRFPSTGFLVYQSSLSSTTITSSSLNSAVTNWGVPPSGFPVTAQVVLRSTPWLLQIQTITSQSGSVITYPGTETARAGYGFFIQNDVRTIDASINASIPQGAWYYNPTTKKIRIFSSSVPTGVQIPTINGLILNTANWITYDNLNITGANTYLFEARNSQHVIIQNCNLTFAGRTAIFTNNLSGISSNDIITVNNNVISDNNECGLKILPFTDNWTVINNTINNSGMIAGMGTTINLDQQNTADAIDVSGAGTTIQNNIITNSGHIGVAIRQISGVTVRNNFIKNWGQVRYDVGAVYSWNPDTTTHVIASRIIDGNVCIQHAPTIEGIGTADPLHNGIYLDGSSKNTTITNNSVTGCPTDGIHIIGSGSVTVRNNTSYANGNLVTYTLPNGSAIGLYYFASATGETINNLNIKSNIFFGRNNNQFCFFYRNDNSNFNYGASDSNYYARPILDNLVFRTVGNNFVNTDRNLAMWQTFKVNQDINSKKSPVAITNVNQLLFLYDSTNTTTTISLPSGTWIDVTGTTYNTGSVTLQPYSSVVLINTGTNVAPTANAGTDKNITLPTTSVSQTGSGNDPDGTIAGYLWTWISGPATGTATPTNTATTTLGGMTVAGTYVFQLRVTDNFGLTGTDQMSVVVNPSAPVNLPPVVNAGGNKVITLPTSFVTQNGSATDPDGTIASYQWTQSILNPIPATIVSPTNPVTSITGMGVSGTYSFTLTATDNLGLTGSQTITVIVNVPNPVAPVANAGSDQVITYPTVQVSLAGSGTDADGVIVAYLWTRLSGSGTITNPNSANTTVTGIGLGTSTFRLTVTDNSGLQGSDDMTVTENQGSASLAYTLLTKVFNNTPQSPNIVTNPAGLPTSTTYNGVGATPINAGSYAVISNITDPNWASSPISGTFTITPLPATITVSNTSQTYDGTGKAVTVITSPAGLSVTVLYNGSPTLPITAGSYTVTATLNETNYSASPVSTTLVINKATPTVSWTPTTPITYPTALSGSQLNATASVGGIFTYTPASGTVLNAGAGQILSLDFVPTDGTNYNSVLGVTTTITVNKGTATINVSNLNQTFDGNPHSVTVSTTPVGLGVLTVLYNGSATPPTAVGSYPVSVTLANSNYNATPFSGTLVISTSAANIFITNLNQVYNASPLPVTVTTNPVGLSHTTTYNGSATVPTNAGSYVVIATINDGIHTGADTQTLVISKATPVIIWSNPAAINFGTALSSTQLNATSTVAGTFAYTPVIGTIPPVGTNTLSTVLTPTDASNYNTVSATVQIVVNNNSATLSLSNLNQTYDGTPKAVTATVSPNIAGVTVTYNGSLTVPTNAGSYTIVVTLNNPNYVATPIGGTLVIAKATSNLTWNVPVPIQVQTKLSSQQLNASSNTSGTFSYNPPLLTTMNAVGTFILTAVFTPTDLVNYQVQTITVPLSVYGSPLLDWFIKKGNDIYRNLRLPP